MGTNSLICGPTERPGFVLPKNAVPNCRRIAPPFAQTRVLTEPLQNFFISRKSSGDHSPVRWKARSSRVAFPAVQRPVPEIARDQLRSARAQNFQHQRRKRRARKAMPKFERRFWLLKAAAKPRINAGTGNVRKFTFVTMPRVPSAPIITLCMS